MTEYAGVSQTDIDPEAQSDEASKAIKVWSAPSVLKAGMTFTQGTFEQVKSFVSEGSFGLRTAGLCCALVLTFVGVMGVLGSLVTLNIFGVAFHFLVFGLGITCVAFENSSLGIIVPGDLKGFVKKELAILIKPYGRSTVYIAMGLIFITMSGLLIWFLGLGLLFGGCFICYNMYSAESALSTMKRSIANEKVDDLFRKYDRNGDGKLSTDEIAKFVSDLGMNLTRAELEAATLVLDRSETGSVSFEEFKLWYVHSDGISK